MKTFAIGLLVVASLGCTRFSNNQTTANKTQTTSSGRPSENGEGVPGYLSNPKAISFTHDGTHLTVQGGVGNLQAVIEYSVLPIHVYRLPTPTETNVKKLGDDAYEITGELLFSSFANPDGSIQARGPDSGTGPYIMKIGGLSTDPLQISSYQTHVTYVFSRSAGSNGQLLSVKLLREEYPTVFVSAVPSIADKSTCKLALRYWNSMTEECTSLRLAKLRNCWPVPDVKALRSMIDDKAGSSVKDKLKDLYESGASLDQCHYDESGTAEIHIVFVESMDGGVKLSVVTVDTSDVREFLEL